MTTLAARTIEALRTEHDDLVALVSAFTADQLASASGASEWSVAQALSHLGSGSEIALAGLRSALGADAPGDDFNASVWDRWNAMEPAAQRDAFIAHNLALVAAFEALTTDQHASLHVPVGFLPAPLTVAAFAGMRLSEVTHHGWDVRVAVDPAIGLLASSTPVLADHLSTELAFLLGFTGRADQVAGPVVLALADSGYSIAIADSVALASTADEATATYSGPLEAALRLISGRLAPKYTPAEVTVTGNVTLDELRAVFPGY